MQKEDRKNRTSKLRRIELLVWVCILSIIIGISAICINNYHNSFETHKIYMPDIYGLIVGSPVNMMGTQVGYVTRTTILKNDMIMVKFKITDRSIHVPKGSVATVELYGLGGSKSLELYPPDSSKKVTEELLVDNNDYIKVERPKRLRDSWSLLYQMYKTLMNIIYAVSNFGAEMKGTEVLPTNSNFNESIIFLNYSNNWIDNSSKNMDNFRQILNKINKK